MSLKRIRKLEDKLKVLEEVEEAKIVEVCRKYQITPWRYYTFYLPDREALKRKNILALIICTDNGPEFRSYRFKELLEKYKVTYEGIHIKHPEENSYIKSFHSILEAEVLNRQEFDSLEELKDTLRR